MSEDLRNPELNALEAALTALKPTTGGLDRDTLMFRAGQESMRRLQWLWPSATVALTIAVMVLGGLFVARPTVRELVEVPVVVPAPPAPQLEQESFEPEPPPPARAAARDPLVLRGDYWRLREEMVAGKASPPATAPSYSAPENVSLDRLLDLPPDALDPVSRSRLNRAFLRTGEPL